VDNTGTESAFPVARTYRQSISPEGGLSSIAMVTNAGHVLKRRASFFVSVL
jgi:hypothetical protein